MKNIILPISLIIVIVLLSCTNKNVSINHTILSESENWKIIKKDSSLEKGHIKLRNSIWLMNFIHWRPITNENASLSVKYTEDVLLNLWGMPFNLTDQKGKSEVFGHEAYYAEGLFNDMVRTRFIVWNCEKTNRQFISDCNINLQKNTPVELFDLQVNDILASICCHHPHDTIENEKITNIIKYDELNISFQIPDTWRSKTFLIDKKEGSTPGYYPDGITKDKGSIWNLITNSEKTIDLIWWEDQIKLSDRALIDAVYPFEKDTIIEVIDSVRVILTNNNLRFNRIINENKHYVGEGIFDIITNIPAYKYIDTTRCLFNTYLWNNNDINYLLLASMVANNKVWGIPFDLTPDKEIFEAFIKEDVIPGINGFPGE